MTLAPRGTEDDDADALERGRRLFAGPCVFVRGVSILSALPPEAGPEIAFAGRSNVGKSSLLNALTGRKTLARTGASSGCTQQLNFFDLRGQLTLVDMPGYGYARASQQDRRVWNALVCDYLRGRRALKCLCLLVDSRRGPMVSDQALMDMLDQAGVAYRLVLTKTDSAGVATALAAARREIAGRAAAFPEVLHTSARRGEGIATLRALLAEMAIPESRAIETEGWRQ